MAYITEQAAKVLDGAIRFGEGSLVVALKHRLIDESCYQAGAAWLRLQHAVRQDYTERLYLEERAAWLAFEDQVKIFAR